MIPYLSDPVFRRKCAVLFRRMIRTRNPDLLESQEGKTKLLRCLTPFDLTSLGVGSCVGTGMYLVAGMVARNYAGPGVIFSFAIAAVAALFSGVCYAEFGVRVPHTTGSAYMYSYVTVGEFLAFVIGWNMLLEYLIGTAACACALSACFDSLSNGAITDSLSDSFGTIFGRPPDVLAFAISVFMTLLLVAGVKKSLVFNNALNAINFSIWVFIMTVGLFYADFDNWTKHGGFLPNGWSGVLTGAATCFYAFIGFDIIATTGEEAIEPKRSIPRAIIMSLIIIVTAYITTGLMATLVLPYDQLDQDSALVEMFAERGSSTGKFIVSLGATAGLTVSMFGSMFPMPRVVYAMAKDGLIFKFLSEVWPMTGTPAVATCMFGLAAAFAALIIRLDVLVEMMSIGTLLAYTLVSTCVLVLRYQPDRLSLVEFLPESMGITDIEHKSPGTIQKSKVTSGIAGPRKVVRIKKPTNVMTSPDSCDETSMCEDRYSMSPTERDDDYLGSGGGMDKPTYGSLPSDGIHSPHGTSMGHQNSGPPPVWGSMANNVGIILQRLRLLQYKLPGFGGNKPWREIGEPTDESGIVVTKLVGVFYLIVLVFDFLVVCDINYMGGSSSTAMFFIFILLLCIIGCLLYISRKPQCRQTLKFMAPGIPFVPGIAITVNIYLIFKLSILTLIRFTLWMIIGLGVYFYYGINNSTLEAGQSSSQNMEMIPQPGDVDQYGDNSGLPIGNAVSNNYYSFPDPRDTTTSSVDTSVTGTGRIIQPASDEPTSWSDEQSTRSRYGERHSDW